MAKVILFTVLAAALLGLYGARAGQSSAEAEVDAAIVESHDGMWFDSANVRDWFWYDADAGEAEAYYVMYDNADQNLFCCVIRVTAGTFQAVRTAAAVKARECGYLRGVEVDGVYMYELVDVED